MTDSRRAQPDLRALTGIRGLDMLLAGGLPANRLHLIEGHPGSGKTTLALNAKAAATFTALSPSHQREYLEWFTEAKTPETRQRRMATALEWLGEGKARNWKYERKA